MQEIKNLSEGLIKLLNDNKEYLPTILTLGIELDLKELIERIDDMEHPDITFYNQHGMTREQWAEKMGSPQMNPDKNISLSSITQDSEGKEEKSMLEKLVDIVESIEKLNEEEPKVSVSVHDGYSTVLIYDIDLFYELSEGYPVKLEAINTDSDIEYRAEFEAYGIEFNAYLNTKELKRYTELLTNE